MPMCNPFVWLYMLVIFLVFVCIVAPTSAIPLALYGLFFIKKREAIRKFQIPLGILAIFLAALLLW